MSQNPDDPDPTARPQSEASENTHPVPAVVNPNPLQITSREEAMAQLSRLPCLLITGIITTAQANSIRSTLTAIIAGHDRAGQRDPGGEVSPELVAQLRRNPEMANQLAGFLPQAVIDRLMEGDQQ